MKVKSLWSTYTTKLGPTILHPQYFVLKELDIFENRIVSYIKKHPKAHVLEVGPGEGKLAFKIKDLCKSYTSLDQPDVASYYQKLLPVDIFANIEDKDTLPNRKFDVIICTQVLEYVLDYNAAIGNIRTMLNKKGELFLSVPFLFPIHDIPHDKIRLSSYAIRKILKSQKFKIKNISIVGTVFSTIVLIFNTALFKKLVYLISQNRPLSIAIIGILPFALLITTILNILALLFNKFVLTQKESSYQFSTCVEVQKS